MLCVVDLQHVSKERLDEPWHAVDVVPRARIVSGIGIEVVKVYEWVDHFASGGEPVRLRNESSLRYGVPTELWVQGATINDWVQSLQKQESGAIASGLPGVPGETPRK